MAIDTSQKRFSMMAMGKPMMPHGVVPSGSYNRVAALWLYTGISPAAPSVVVYVRAPITLSFDAFSTKEIAVTAQSTKELVFDALTTKELNFEV